MKKTVSIILCALILISATFVFANSEETVTAVRTVFNMLVRGEEVSVPDMVVIDGRTYVPLRTMGELLDVNVDWDEETRTVLVKNNEIPKGQDFTNYLKINDGTVEEIARVAVKYSLGESILENASCVVMKKENLYQVAFLRDDLEGYLLVQVGLDGSIISISAENE
ncbi:MAG: hypothetical protein II359_07065 [Clostridia bacterium]|nr:hypothetical protein [Clostridia bacterium]